MRNKYPLYIVSKGRWQHERRLTARVLEMMHLPYYIVVEQQEAEEYRETCDPKLATVLVLDAAYQRDYDTCDDLGDSKGKGPGPARNFVWDHAIKLGFAWHWVMDDNIHKFYRLYRNMKILLGDGAAFRAMEDWCERYANVAMAGPNYRGFASQRSVVPPVVFNTRIYSCNLIRNDIPFRWRGRYNEDTDLSLRILKKKWCTAQFNAFLQDKARTQTVKGGNTAEFYEKEGTLDKSQMLVKLHPDVTRLVWRFGRLHHHVNYAGFRNNRLKLRTDVVLSSQANEYGMELVTASRDAVATKVL